MRQDEVLYSEYITRLLSLPQPLLLQFTPAYLLGCTAVGIADRVKNFAVLYVCDLDQVPDFKQMYELYDPVTLMFFFRNKHMVGPTPSNSVTSTRNADLCIDVRFRDRKQQ